MYFDHTHPPFPASPPLQFALHVPYPTKYLLSSFLKYQLMVPLCLLLCGHPLEHTLK